MIVLMHWDKSPAADLSPSGAASGNSCIATNEKQIRLDRTTPPTTRCHTMQSMVYGIRSKSANQQDNFQCLVRISTHSLFDTEVDFAQYSAHHSGLSPLKRCIVHTLPVDCGYEGTVL